MSESKEKSWERRHKAGKTRLAKKLMEERAWESGRGKALKKIHANAKGKKLDFEALLGRKKNQT